MAKRTKTDPAKWMARRDAIAAQVRSVNFQTFACLWVEFITSYGDVDGYTLVARGGQWAIRFGGADSIVGDASKVYGWIERSPLRRLAIEAEEWRQELYAAA